MTVVINSVKHRPTLDVRNIELYARKSLLAGHFEYAPRTIPRVTPDSPDLSRVPENSFISVLYHCGVAELEKSLCKVHMVRNPSLTPCGRSLTSSPSHAPLIKTITYTCFTRILVAQRLRNGVGVQTYASLTGIRFLHDPGVCTRMHDLY